MVKLQTETEVEQQLAAYFHDEERRNNNYNITIVGHLLNLEVDYYDFKPIKQVRRDLDAMFPNLNSLAITRYFTSETIGDVITENLGAVVRTEEGEEMPVYDFIENKMYCVELKEVAV